MYPKGLSLIEVLISLVILAIATMLLGHFMLSFTSSREAQTDTQVQALARSYMDALRAEWQIPALYSSNATPSVSFPSGYSSALQVSAVDANLKTVTLTITNPRGRTYAFVTRVAAPL